MATTRHPGAEPHGLAFGDAGFLATDRRSLLLAWEAAVRASSAVENWHSVLRPYLAVHRRLSSGMVALLAVWHNHRITERGLHRGQSPLMRSGMTQASPDWLVALGYPPHGETYSPESLVHPQPALALAA